MAYEVCAIFILKWSAQLKISIVEFLEVLHEAMTDLIYLFSTIVDKDGKILISDIYKDVAPLTDKEKALYSEIEFSVDECRNDVGTRTLMHKEKKKIS
ncbi:hypothetical protein NQ317_012809 [Molorchus minor]|uniref:Uncharacterized protein n=1 Tax=Molorchus minor TaxID=1323400 RepID=A0ABQ9K566_9CUCU|nr:hypothetical protein NQ317_012809 [Molorchus minor]